jgi:Fur family transcriptional regulator, ferric uptake regulator
MERNTRQRDAIRAAIEASTRPLLPQEVLAMVRTAVPGVGLATIYRNLKLLVAEGTVQMITLPGDSPRYETTESDHHHHFQCTTCQRVYDIAGCPGNLRRLAPRGFTVDHHDVTLYGRCSDCGKNVARVSR